MPHYDGLLAYAIFTQVCHRHKGPVVVTFSHFLERPGDGKMTADTAGRLQFDGDVTTAVALDVHGDGDTLDSLEVCVLEYFYDDFKGDCEYFRARKSLSTLWDRVVGIDPRAKEPGLWINVLRGLSYFNDVDSDILVCDTS